MSKSMATSEMVKNAIISEIEENLSTQRQSIMQDDLLGLCADRDCLVTPFALQKAINYGIDPRYTAPKQAYGNSSAATGSQVEKERSQDESIVEDQFDEFLNRLELLESEDCNGMDDDDLDFSIKERILMLKLEKAVFDPLFSLIRTSRPTLYQAVLQHPIIAGQPKSNKKLSKKEKKRDRKNEMNKEKEKIVRTSKSQRRDKSNFSGDGTGAFGTLADLRASPEKRAASNREMLAAMLAKTVVEGSLSGHLVAISLLIQTMKDERTSGSFSSGIPIGNILASLFERPDGDDDSDTSDVAGASSTQNNSGSARDNTYLPNPLKAFLLSARDEPAKSVAYSDMSRGDIGSLDETRTEDTASQLGGGEGSMGYPGPQSDAGSTAGSTRAEQGTETASVDEEGTEDEQLAQALAMSMRGTAVNSNSNSDSTAVYDVTMPLKTFSAHSSAASSSGSVSFTGDRCPTQTPHMFSKVEPMSTFGPISSPEYWRVLSCNEYPDHSGDLPTMTLRHTVIALLTIVRAGADKLLGDDFSLSMLTPPTTSRSIFEANQGPTSMYVFSTPSILPSTIAFQLLELLLDQLVGDLKEHCEKNKGDSSSPRKEQSSTANTVNAPLTQVLLKERESKGKQTIFATQAAVSEEVLTDLEVEMREWAFERYFLVWSISSIIRVMRATFCVAKDRRCSNFSLGLGIIGDLSSAANSESESKIPRSNSFPTSTSSTSDGTRNSPPSLPLALRLLQHVEFCMGLSLDNVEGDATKAALSLTGVSMDELLSHRTARDALCTRLLKYPTHSHPSLASAPHSSSSLSKYPEQHSVVGYRHVLRISAVDCCVSGLMAFRPQQGDREALLSFLLSNTAMPEENSQAEYSPELFGLVRSSGGAAGTGLGVKDHPLSGCMTYFLQEMCLRSAQLMSKLRSGSPSTVLKAQQGVKSDVDSADEFDSPKYKNKSGQFGSKKLSDDDLENVLFNRLKYAKLTRTNSFEVDCAEVVHSVPIEEFAQQGSTPNSLVFWGELQLLHTLQKKYMKAYSQTTGGNIAYSPTQICFNVRRCHQDITISGDNKVVTHRNSKLWASISALRSFAPGSGVHEWALRIDKSDRGHVFVGVVTADASMDSYIGSDRSGWGIIGTRGLWHGRAKVASDFGSGFGNQSVVRLRLDTDQGTLSISTNDFVWAVAFDNLPGVELFPAVSLYHREDCISLVTTEASSTPSSPPSESPYMKDTGSALAGAEAISSYVRYTQTLCTHVDALLRTAETMESVADRAVVLSHPFIGLLLPSAAACALESQSSSTAEMHSPASTGYLAVQLAPYFTIMAKRLSSLQDSVCPAKEISGGKPLSACGFIGSIGGLWTLHSSPSPCNTIAAQKYKLNIDYPFIPLGLKVTHQSSNAAETPGKGAGGQYLAAARIAGSGRFSSVSVTLSGTQLGTRLKFLEKWSTGSGCLLDVRLSLCGSFFSGTYTDVKSGKSGDVEGSRTSLQVINSWTVRESLSKSCLLCTMVCGKLAASLISLQYSPLIVSMPGKDTIDDGETSAKRGSGTGLDGSSEIMEEGEGEDDEKEKATANATEEAEILEKGHLLVVKWLRSDLFSGGLPLDAHLTRHLDDEIRSFTSLQCSASSPSRIAFMPAPSSPTAQGLSDDLDCSSPKSAAELADDSHSLKGLMSWWLEMVFPSFIVDPTKPKNTTLSKKMVTENITIQEKLYFLTEDSPVQIESFIRDLVENRGAGKRVDEYVSHHVGLSALSKMGGSAMQVARRLVVAALVKHSGCVSICLAEEEALSTGMKVLSERPMQLLVDVWRSAQRCVEHAIRSKKGSSYDTVGAILGRKAELLLELTPNAVGLAAHEAHTVTAAEMQRYHQQQLLCPQLTGAHDSRTEVPSEAMEDSSRQLGEASEFLMSTLRDTAPLRSQLLRASFHTVTRIAGLKTFMLLFNKVDQADAPLVTGRLPALSAIGMQPAAIEYLFLAFRDLTDEAPYPKGLPVPAVNSGTTPTIDSAATTGLSGHYSDGLHGVCPALMEDLKSSFESTFEFITQLMSRCTWAGDRDGQCISLVCWGIRIKPDDHLFLNRTTGIFRVLQTVLNDARTSMALASDKARGPGGASVPFPRVFKSPLNISGVGETALSSPGGVFTMSLLEHRQGPYGAEMTQNTLKRLAQLVLKVVHSLASQVAFCKDGTAPLGSIPLAPRLQRMPSGPDTLSQSLFDMLYAELFSGWKTILSQMAETESKQPSSLTTPPSGRSSLPLSTSSSLRNLAVSESRQDDLLEGEQYIYRILRLLYFVSISKVCQRSLSSPKWLSLLLLSFGCGGFSTQRRTLRLLRRLLMNMDPKDFRAFVPSLCGDREEMTSADMPFDEDDVNAFIKDQDEQLSACGERIPCTERLVRLFLEGTSVILSNSAVEDDAARAFHSQLDLNNTREALSTECVAALRFLQTLPAWREVIVKSFHKVLRGHSTGNLSAVNWTDPTRLRTTAASLGVIGGYVDYLRVGGIVTLRPFCLISPTDTLASRLAGVYHCCAMLVSQMPQNGVVEVVLMERSSKPVREGANKSEKCTGQQKPLQYSATTLSTALPVRAVRVNATDIVPSPDIPVVPEFTTTAVFNDVLHILHSFSIPWLKAHTRTKAGGDEAECKESDGDDKIPPAAESKDEESVLRMEFKAREEDEDDMEEEDMEEESFSAENNEDDEDIFHNSRSTALVGEQVSGQSPDIGTVAPMSSIGSLAGSASPCTTVPRDKERDGPRSDPLEAPPTVEQEVDALQTFVNLSAFRAFSASLQCNALAYALIPDSPTSSSSDVSSPRRVTDRNHTTSATPSPNNSRPSSPAPDSAKDAEDEMNSEAKQNIIEDIISLAVQETNCGGVCVIEAMEERWTALWGAYEAFSRRRRDPKETGGAAGGCGPLDSPPASKGSFSAVEILRTRASDPVAEADTFTRHISRNIISSNPLLDAAASIGLFSHFGSQLASRASATVDPATQAAAIAQMTDMGLPHDWCEVALRRCRYNVELAINMCFENGADMPQIVAEDAIIQAASRRETESSSTRRHRPARDEPEREEASSHDGREGTSAAARIQYLMSHARHLDATASEPGARHPSLASRISSDHRRVMNLRPHAPASASAATSAMVSQLLDMGFPPHWCARAMHATNNDVDAALSWILSHGEELVADGVIAAADPESSAIDKTSDQGDLIHPMDYDQPTQYYLNPLCTVSGSSEIRDTDLTCTALNGGFPSVGCRGFPVFQGKWYFEVKVHTAGCVQIGWVDSAYDGGADVGEGVGDDAHSWAFDGWRMYLWHELSAEWGAKWSPGDVVGCAVDLDLGQMSFFLNGLGEEVDMGLAFSSMDVSGGLYPCASFNRGEVIQFNFGSTPFAFPPPVGYLPYADHVLSSMAANRNFRSDFAKSLKSLVSFSSTAKPDSPHASANWSRLVASEQSQMNRDINADCDVESNKTFFFENSLEEAKGEREFYWGRRYFPTEESSRSVNIGERPLRYPTANLPVRIPKDREGLMRQIESLSRDLCIMYCRMSVFQILRSFPKLKDKKALLFNLLMARKSSTKDSTSVQVPIMSSSSLATGVSTSASRSGNSQSANAALAALVALSENSSSNNSIDFTRNALPDGIGLNPTMFNSMWKEISFEEHMREQEGSSMDRVLLLLRQTCATTQRTKIYLQTVAMLHSVAHLPQNIGSVFAAGGAPMLEQIRHCMSDMLALPPTNGSVSPDSSSDFANILLGHIQVDTANSVRRDLASEWRLEGGIAPVICRDVTLSDSACINLPSLALAVWMTNLVLSLFVERGKAELIDEVAQDWVVKLARYWSFSLRSPSLPVKSCAMRMLCAVISSCTSPALASRAVAEIPLKRLRVLGQVRLGKEKGSLPICSEYLQTLLELVAIGSNALETSSIIDVCGQTEMSNISGTKRTAIGKAKERATTKASGGESAESTENWEALSGRLISDEGWETWTGHVHQRGVSEVPTAIQRLQERQDLPPELMPGCKVCRKRSYAKDASPSKSASAVTLSESEDEDSQDSPPGLLSPPRRALSELLRRESVDEGRAAPSPSPSLLGELSAPSLKAMKADAEDQIGTVLEVGQWPLHHLGSARLIKWDDVAEPELVRWDADDGKFDVTHVKMKNGKITARLPHPQPRLLKIASRFFGVELTYGVILRLRKEVLRGDEGGDVTGRYHGVMEWPDFVATIRVRVVVRSDGSKVITEESVVSGPCHTGWDTRFAQSAWRAGTTYVISSPTSTPINRETSSPSGGASNSSNCQSAVDITDKRNGEMRGAFSYPVHLADKMVEVVGDIYLQQSRLFVFDVRNSYYNITVSNDKMTVAKNGGSGQACAFGSVGFSSGIHYWEFKIEQADAGSIFLGVADKPGVIGSSQASRFGRWVGSGLANHRASFRSSSQTAGDRLSVYGDHFHTGDTVGVLLDMNRGRLSFYLDGLKYGQHSIADLGEAFDGLSSANVVKKRTMFPIVGLSKSQDRIAITSRWLSLIGTDQKEEVQLVEKAHQLLTAWSASLPPSNSPHVEIPDSVLVPSTHSPSASSISAVSNNSSMNSDVLHSTSSWLFQEAFNDWKRWKSARYIRVRSRCQAAGPMVAVDITPRACVEACIRLGLPYALLRGDRVLFSRSSGRKLDIKEEAVILGACKGQLWYRLDSQQGQMDGGIMDSAALAWSLVPSDVEGLTLLRRSYTAQPTENADSFGMSTNLDVVGGFFRDSGSSSVDSTCSSEAASEDDVTMKSVAELPLPRIPSFQGGLVLVTYANGAVMRDGLEIDTSEVLCSVPAETVVYALEQRLNSSNVWRLRVIYGGHYGWISERMRGGSEEFMLKKVLDPPHDVLEKAIRATIDAVNELHITDRVRWDLQPSISAAMEKWDDMVLSIGRGDILEAGKEPTGTFLEFCELAKYSEEKREWSVEMDMQLAEFVSQCAAKEGSTPQNVSAEKIAQAIQGSGGILGESFASNTHVLSEGSLLCGVHADRVIARASLLRVANQTLRYALPYINMTLLEEKQRRDCFGSDDAIDIDPTTIPPKDSSVAAVQSTAPPLFAPPSSARRLRAMRRLLFGHTKSSFFESVLEATATPTPLHQDEYEDPREIKTLRINRVRATQSRLATISSQIERMRQTVFGQLHRELRAWPSSSFRRSYVGKGHGGQRRAFKVKFMGEGVNDYGGPYRAVFEQVVDELQADAALVGRKPSERALLPLLMPSANRSSGAGANQDKFVLSTAPCSPLHQELAQFFGKLLGAAVRHNLTLALDLSPMLWRPLVRLPVSRVQLQAVDAFFANTLADVTRVGLAHEALAVASELKLPKKEKSKEDILSFSESVVDERELQGTVLDGEYPSIGVPSTSSSEAVQPEEWVDLTFSVYLPDGTRMPLVSGGEDFPVTLDNWREYVQLAERVRLREGFVMYKVLRDGLSSVLPVELLPLFTPQEVEQLVSGTSTVDVALLRQCTDYEDLSPDCQLVRNFWEVLEGMTPEQHTLFLRFVWARSRMPASAQDLPMNFKLQSGQGAAREKPDSYLPHAQTCFFSLSLPAYSTKEILRAKLLYAINNSPTMDADVRLHSAEGWADS